MTFIQTRYAAGVGNMTQVQTVTKSKRGAFCPTEEQVNTAIRRIYCMISQKRGVYYLSGGFEVAHKEMVRERSISNHRGDLGHDFHEMAATLRAALDRMVKDRLLSVVDDPACGVVLTLSPEALVPPKHRPRDDRYVNRQDRGWRKARKDKKAA